MIFNNDQSTGQKLDAQPNTRDRPSEWLHLHPTPNDKRSSRDNTPPPLGAPKPNTYALFSTAAGPLKGKGSDVRDVQERWVDAKEEWDAYEKVQWRKEGETLRDEVARKEAQTKEKAG